MKSVDLLVGVGPGDVHLEVSLLAERVQAERAHVRSLARVLLHMDLKIK